MGEETVPLPQLSSAHQSGVKIAGNGFKIETSDFCTSCKTIVDLMLHLNFENSGERCLNFGPYYDSSTGELLGERCNEWGDPESASDWDLTDCTDNGGEIIWNANAEENSYYYRLERRDYNKGTLPQNLQFD